MSSIRIITVFLSITLSVVFAAVPFIDEPNTTFLEENCNKMMEIGIDEKVHHVRLTRNTVKDSKTCKVHIALSSIKNLPLMITVHKIRISNREPEGFCTQHFLQINGLADSRTYVRLCGMDDLTEEEKHLKLLENGDKYLYYLRNSVVNNTHDLDLVITPIVKPGVDGSCPLRDPLSPKLFKCLSGNMCLPEELKCDKYSDCGDASDELDCGIKTTLPPPTTVSTTVATVDGAAGNFIGGAIKPENRTPIIVGGLLGIIVIIVLIALIAFFIIKKKRNAQFSAVPTYDRPPTSRPSNTRGSVIEEERINTTPMDPSRDGAVV